MTILFLVKLTAILGITFSRDFNESLMKNLVSRASKEKDDIIVKKIFGKRVRKELD